jgi:hypothetical protein
MRASWYGFPLFKGMLVFRYWFVHFYAGQVRPVYGGQSFVKVLADICKLGFAGILYICRSLLVWYIIHSLKNSLGF